MFCRLAHVAARVIGVGFLLCWFVGVIALADDPEMNAALAAGQEMVAFYREGEFEKAAAAAERHTAALEKVFGIGTNETADGYALQAKFYGRAGNATKSRAAREKALRILSTTRSRKPELDSGSLLSLAMASSDLDEFDVAADLAIRATAILQQEGCECHPIYSSVLASLAPKSSDEGRPRQEERCLELGLWAATKAFGEESSERLDFLIALASVRQARQRFLEGAALYETAIAIGEKASDRDERRLATCSQAAALCRELAGDYAKAEAIGRKAAESVARIAGPQSQDAVDILQILARACAHQGKWEEAESFAKQSLTIVDQRCGELSEEASVARQTLALVYALQERCEEAEGLIRKSLAASEMHKHSVDDVILYASSLAHLLWSAGKHDEARQIFERTISTAKKAWGKDDARIAIIEANLAANYSYQGKYEEAETLTRQSLERLRSALGEDHPKLAILYINLATIEAAQGRWAEAAENNEIGCHGMAQHMRGQLAVLPPVEQLRLLRGQHAIGYQAALTMGMLQRSNPRICTLSAGWLTNGKAIAHEASARQSQMAVQTAAHGQDIAAAPWVDIDTVRAHIPPAAVFIDIARFDVFDYGARRKGEDWKPARYAAWIVPPQGKGSVEVVDLGEAAAIDAAVAAYRDTLRAASGDKGAVANGGEAKAEQVLTASAKPLVDKVLQPIMAGVRAAGCEQSATELIISPDGELWLVPWAALPLEDGRYLVEKYVTETVTSGRDLLPSDEKVEVFESLVFANPSFDLSATELVKAVRAIDAPDESPAPPADTLIAAASAGQRSVSEIGRVEPLPASVGEARRVAGGIEDLTGKKPRVFLQDRALEERVKRARSPHILHFATHGFVLPDQVASVARIEQQSMLSSPDRAIQGLTSEAGEPLEDPLLRCGLLLAGCNAAATDRPEGVDDGCLTGKEIVALDLRGTKLVVLSACETGLGRVQYGEGVAGLRQAFLIAGAEAVLASLWQVSDSDAAALVSRFFAKLADSQKNAFALREAQLDMIRKRRKEKGAAHPVAWAAFQVTGH
jgi:CHAT domain-containing protein/tetratricopeptide (TPR) repeat protein